MSRLDHLEAYHLAIELVKKAGFVLDHVSRQTETCYFKYPGLIKLMRISTHRGKKSPIGHNNVCARVSFVKPKSLNVAPHYESSVHLKIVEAIGNYFLTDPKPSRYKGKKGTWIKDDPFKLAT